MLSATILLLAAACSFFTTTGAHMIMATPQPFGTSDLNNSPLARDGSDFPCKQRANVYALDGASNTMAIGESQILSFKGSAVHGGGSCQISLTTDLKPTAQSSWQVIHSIVGGCPIGGAAGNLGSNDPATFNYTIPDGIVPGQYVLAWTWFNRIGNREMYMNCAPVTVTGGSGKREIDAPQANPGPAFSKRKTFPAMYLACIQSGACQSQETFDLAFPDPGDSVVSLGAAPPKPATGAACPTGGSSGGGSPPPPVSASSTPTSPAAPPVSATPTAVSVTPTAVSPPPTTTPSVIATPVSIAAPTGTGTGSTGGSGSGSTGGSMACPTVGQEVCSPDGTMIGMCDLNNKAVMMAVAPGTKCAGGYMVAASKNKRDSFRFAREPVRKHVEW